MHNLNTNTAVEINRHHDLASAKAGEALNHALEAGKLLLEAKAAIPHGEWTDWLAANVTVTLRQAQRYIAHAQGKPLPVRAIGAKNDTVSLLPDQWTPRPAFIPLGGHWYWCASKGKLMDFVIEPSREHPGFFFVSHLYRNGDLYDCTNRPVRADWVETNLQHFGLAEPAKAQWHIRPHAGVIKALETVNASGMAS